MHEGELCLYHGAARFRLLRLRLFCEEVERVELLHLVRSALCGVGRWAFWRWRWEALL